MRLVMLLLSLALVVTSASADVPYPGCVTNAWTYGHNTPLSRTPQKLSVSPAIQYSDYDKDPVIKTEDGYWA